MASSVEFLNFVCEQISGIGSVRFRKMFGDGMVYLNDKPVILVCNDTAYVKKLDCIASLMTDAGTGIPYDGAKEHYILDIDNADFAKEIVLKIEAVTPLPKSKKRKA